MKLNFWNRFKSSNEKGTVRLKGPRELPQQVGSYLVVNKSMDPDVVWALRCVVKPRETKDTFDFRVFSPSQVSSSGIRIENFHSLDTRAEFILHQGWYNKFTNQVVFTEEVNHAA